MEEEKLSELIKAELKISDGEKGVERRKKIASTVKQVSQNILKVLGSTLSNKEKAKKIRNLMKNGTWLSAVVGVWNIVSKTTVNVPGVKDIVSANIDITSIIEIGPTFWLKVAAILFLLRIIHKIVSTGVIVTNDIKGTWNGIKNVFKVNLKEGFVSLEEYKNLKLLLE